jgi:hypothetical protein
MESLAESLSSSTLLCIMYEHLSGRLFIVSRNWKFWDPWTQHELLLFLDCGVGVMQSGINRFGTFPAVMGSGAEPRSQSPTFCLSSMPTCRNRKTAAPTHQQGRSGAWWFTAPLAIQLSFGAHREGGVLYTQYDIVWLRLQNQGLSPCCR